MYRIMVVFSHTAIDLLLSSETTQNICLRLASETISCTPVIALYVKATIPPLRRPYLSDKSTINNFSNNPSSFYQTFHNIYQKWHRISLILYSFQVLKYNCLLLPSYPSQYFCQSFNNNNLALHIDLHFRPSRWVTLSLFNQEFISLIHSKWPVCLSVFTDGSKSASSVHVSFVIPNINLTKCFTLPNIPFVFTAKAWAIYKTPSHIIIHNPAQQIILLLDSKSFLSALRNSNFNSHVSCIICNI